MAQRDTSEFLLTAHAGLHMLCHAARDPVAVIVPPRGTIVEVNGAFRRLFDIPDPLPPDLELVDLGDLALARALSRWDGARPRLVTKLAVKGVDGRARLLALPATRPLQAFFHFMPRRPRRHGPPERLQQLLDERLAQIRNFERLRSLGEIAAVIVHELRTPLTSVRVAVEGARRSPAVDPSVPKKLDAAIEQIERLDRLLNGIRNFSRPYTLSPRPIDVRETISAALRAVEGHLQGPQTTVTVEVKPDPLTIVADPERLVEALQNVIVNAIESMSEGGTVSITAAPSRGRGGWIDLRVVDQGAGFSPTAMERIFEPFFTTKVAGTGLGLPIVRKIVELHGGFVSLKSAEGRGTVVLVELPSGTKE